MICDKPLTDKQRKISQTNYFRYNLINGASYMCLGETVVILFAVKLHAPNYVVAVIGSMIYVGFLLLPLGRLRTAQVGAAKSQADFWVCRNISALLVGLSAFLMLVNQYLAWGAMLLGSFLFYGFRAAGVVMSQPMMGNITKDNERSELIGKANFRFYASSTAALIVISISIQMWDSIWVLLAIIVAGASMGITASTFLRKIDETRDIQKSARRPLLPQLKLVFMDLTLRRQIFAEYAANVAMIMLEPVSLLALKRGYGVSDAYAVVFSVTRILAACLVSKVFGRLDERFGARKLAIYIFSLVFPVCLFWIFFPEKLSASWQIWFLLFPFMLLGASKIAVENSFIHYFLMTVPPERQVASSMFIRTFTGVGAGLTGMLLSSVFLKGTEHLFGKGVQMFKAYFIVSLLLCAVSIFVISGLKKVGNKTIKL